MKHGSLFSGIEGFGLGFERAGFTLAWQVEQDEFCNRVLARHWPSVQRFTDVRKVGRHNLEKVDCITAGVPCQDVSIAGKRAGLAGERTGLFYEFARILQELRPTWFVFENVPGLFSSNSGRDFAEVLRVLMVECGYGVSWRVLDSRYFNVAQRRERVFIVGRFGKPCPAEILFESEGGGGDFAPRRTSWANIAASLTEGTGRVGGKGCDDGANIAVTLSSGSGVTGNAPGRRREDDYNIVRQAISAKWSKGSSGPAGDEHHNLVVAGPLNRENGHCINAEDAAGNHIIAIQDVRGRRDNRQNGIGISQSETMYSLTKVDRHAVAFAENQRGEIRTSRIAPQLSAGGGKPGSGYSAVAYALREDPGGTGQAHNCTYIIDKERSSQQHAAREVDGTVQRDVDDGSPPDPNGVRDFASLPKGMDSPRYRALGNAVTASVAEWIGKRLMSA